MKTDRPNAFKHKQALCMNFTVEDLTRSVRADLYLQARVGRLSRHKAQGIIERGELRFQDHGLIKTSQRLRKGQLLSLWRFPPDEKEALDKFVVPVVFENEDFLVVNKPPFLAVHPTARDLYCTLTAWLTKHYGKNRPNPCHRLDRETSGLLLCAKNKQTERALKTAFQNQEVEKTYLAVVEGELEEIIDIHVPLALQGERGLVRIKMIPDKAAPEAITRVEPVSHHPEQNRTLVRCFPKTGRQHQIRAHLAHAGHPIVGDKLYGMGETFFDQYTKGEIENLEERLPTPRHALHAESIAFSLPGNEKVWNFKCELPKGLSALLAPVCLRSHGTCYT